MKKAILACALVAGFALSSSLSYASNPWNTILGTTTKTTNGSGGTTTSCPTSTNNCTTSQLQSDGSYLIIVYNYDRHGELTGTTRLRSMSGDDAHNENPDGGFIHSVETYYGVLYGAVAN